MDVSSLSLLIEKHRRPISHFLSRRSGPLVLQRTSIEDLYQETMTAALAKAAEFTFVDEPQFLAWVYVIARGNITEILRDKVLDKSNPIPRDASSCSSTVPTCLLSGNRSPSSMAAYREHENALALHLRNMRADYRKVLVSYCLEQRSLADVAKRMNRSKSATCQMIVRAIDALRLKMPA